MPHLLASQAGDVMAGARGACAFLVLAAGAACFKHFSMRAAGHVGMQMGTQNGPPTGGIEVFFVRGGRAGGHPAGQEWLSLADKAKEGNKTWPSLFQNVESEEAKAKEQRKAQCAVCGKWWQLSTTCGGPSFAGERAFGGVSPANKVTEKKPRISFKAALEIAKDGALIASAVKELKKDFWADSNKESQASKRRLVVELAQAIGGEWWTPPLNVDVVLGVAAALKAAGLKTAAALINELKLWHIEQGHSVSDSLARLLWLAKKSVSRNLGPVKRAQEVKIAEVDSWLWQCSRRAEICEPILAYAWAVVFMLRCAEVAAVRWMHVFADKSKKVVALKTPISKTDQAGWGVRRTLGCCGLRKCPWTCAWRLWTVISERATSKSEFVFVDKYEGVKSTRSMTLAWKDKLKEEMSGHSARRSGAMMYVRAGLPIQEVAGGVSGKVERWKSNVVLNYAEEALEEVPANQRIMQETGRPSSKDFAGWKSPKTPRTTKADMGNDTPVPMTPPASCAMGGASRSCR